MTEDNKETPEQRARNQTMGYAALIRNTPIYTPDAEDKKTAPAELRLRSGLHNCNELHVWMDSDGDMALSVNNTSLHIASQDQVRQLRDYFQSHLNSSPAQPAAPVHSEAVAVVKYEEDYHWATGTTVSKRKSIVPLVDLEVGTKLYIAKPDQSVECERCKASRNLIPVDGEPEKELYVLRYKASADVGGASYMTTNAPTQMQHRYVIGTEYDKLRALLDAEETNKKRYRDQRDKLRRQNNELTVRVGEHGKLLYRVRELEWLNSEKHGEITQLRHTAKQQAARIAELAVAQAWRPIETAPKDGECIMLWENYSITPFIGFWSDRYKEWEASLEHYGTDGNAMVISNLTQNTITRWMPLPAAPVTTESPT